MKTDNPNQPATDSQKDKTNSAAGTQPQHLHAPVKTKMASLKKYSIIILSVVAVIFIILFIVFMVFRSIGNKNAKETAEIYQMQVAEVVPIQTLADPKSLQEAKDALRALPGFSSLSDVEKEKMTVEFGPEFYAAYASGLAPNSIELKNMAASLGNNPTRQLITNFTKDIISSKLELVKTTGYYEGYVFYFWFGKTIVNKAQGEFIPDWGNAKVLAEDREYAKTLANSSRDSLKKNAITPAELVTQLLADTRLRLPDEENTSSFFASDLRNFPGYDDGRAESLASLLQKQTGPGISEIGIIVADAGQPASGQKKEVGFFFVKLDKALRGQGAIDYYQAQLKIAKGLAQ
jgi:hypothetical protein